MKSVQCEGVFYSSEHIKSDGDVNNGSVIAYGEKCIITVTPTSLEFCEINEKRHDRKGHGDEFSFQPSQLEVEREEVIEKFLIFNIKYYELTFIISYSNLNEKRKSTVKVSKKNGDSILNTIS